MSNRLRRLAAPLLLPVVALWAGPLAAAPKVVPTTSTTPQVVPMHRVKVALPSGTQTTADGRFHYTSQIVIDGNTGLTWERAPSESKRDWSASKSYCGALNLGGKSDWRVPRVEELKSLFAKVGTDTHLVAGHPFTVSTQERWTASGDPARRFGLLVGNGNYFNHPVADTLAVWCVRGGDNTAYPGSNLRFPYVEGSNYKQVLDTQTGLVWRTQPTALGDWFKARGECRDVGVGWRLATRAEYDALSIPRPRRAEAADRPPFQNVWSPDYDGRPLELDPAEDRDGDRGLARRRRREHQRQGDRQPPGFCVKGDTSATRFTLVDDGASVLDQETQIVDPGDRLRQEVVGRSGGDLQRAPRRLAALSPPRVRHHRRVPVQGPRSWSRATSSPARARTRTRTSGPSRRTSTPPTRPSTSPPPSRAPTARTTSSTAGACGRTSPDVSLGPGARRRRRRARREPLVAGRRGRSWRSCASGPARR
ncbi:MAG: DUF1566 domain-containing protein [Nannocystaceae bacterium]